MGDEGLAPYIAIAGQKLDLEGHRLRVGIPRVEALVPAANLAARLVTFHQAKDVAAFEANVRRELRGWRLPPRPNSSRGTTQNTRASPSAA